MAEGVPSALPQKAPFFYQGHLISVKSYQERPGFAYCCELALFPRKPYGREAAMTSETPSSFLVSVNVTFGLIVSLADDHS
jgi:hypothetical protein